MIGGKVLDSSVLVALTRGSLAAEARLDVVRVLGIPLFLPELALAEARALRPDTTRILDDLLNHPSVVRGDLGADQAAADQVDQLLTDASTDAVDDHGHHLDLVDILAGHVVHTARRRGWPALTTDPDRLHRLDPDLTVELL